ncbi:hypothetical protein ACFL1A_00390 [Patescibacteria group bacterium]
MSQNIQRLKAIIVIGKPGCGKSVMVWYLGSLLVEDGFKVKFLSDRIGLEDAVIKDVKGVKPDKDGIKYGKHSKLIADGPPGHRKVHILDGYFLNKVHEKFISDIVNLNNRKVVTIIEYAIGPIIDFGPKKSPLLQDSKYLISLIKKNRVKKSILVIDVEANLKVRQLRESSRSDSMAPETFEAYFPDGGEITKSQERILGNSYIRFLNNDEDHDGYFSEARYIYEVNIKPYLL